MDNKKCTESLLIERIISCEPIKIILGVLIRFGKEFEDNIYERQCIKLNNDNKLYSLISYSETNEILCFKFENNIDLNFTKKDNDIICTIGTETFIMNNIIRKCYKKMNFNSDELDRIVDFIKPN
jgi:hypothetical protein